MSSAGNSKKIQPIIVKRVKKVSGHGHHGGAWKIAYADFVTAMMAFFLLMWLLGSTTKGDLEGIAEYFQTPLKIALSGGSGSGESSSVIRGGGEDFTRSVGNVRRGDVSKAQQKADLQRLQAELRKVERAKLTRLKEQVEEVISRNVRLAELRSQILLDITPDGLRIQIVDDQNRPMFDIGRAIVKDYMRELLREIGKVLNGVENRVSLSGHTDSAPYNSGERGYSNWELSADRANASRRELVAGGMEEEKVVRVIGLGPSVMFDAENPRNPMNRRISIVVLNKQAQERVFSGTEVDVSATEEAETALDAPAGGSEGQAAGESGVMPAGESRATVVPAGAAGENRH